MRKNEITFKDYKKILHDERWFKKVLDDETVVITLKELNQVVKRISWLSGLTGDTIKDCIYANQIWKPKFKDYKSGLNQYFFEIPHGNNYPFGGRVEYYDYVDDDDSDSSSNTSSSRYVSRYKIIKFKRQPLYYGNRTFLFEDVVNSSDDNNQDSYEGARSSTSTLTSFSSYTPSSISIRTSSSSDEESVFTRSSDEESLL